ncbi:zincin [Agrocybe pediades]|nr:zincin [Agrocybe pediades]
MFFPLSFSILSLAAGMTLATPLKRADGISIKLATPSSTISSLNDLELTATVVNEGPQTVSILKYGTVLDDKLPTQSFMVTKDNSPVAFNGIKVSVSMAHTDDTAFAVIEPGKNLTVKHNIASIYDFASAGTGKFTFKPNAHFLMSSQSNDAKMLDASSAPFSHFEVTSSESVDVEITGGLISASSQVLHTRAFNNCTDPTKKNIIDLGYAEAKMLTSNASSYVTAEGNNTLFDEYFGSTPTADVIAVLNGVANENNSSRSLNCVDVYGACTESGLIAYTIIATTDIFFCDIFFQEAVPATSLCNGTSVDDRIVRGGTVLHELTHAIGATVDITYGCEADQALTPAEKVSNADNFNCFTTQVYADTKC